MAGTAGIIAAALSALGGITQGVAGAAHGPGSSALGGPKAAGAAPFTPTAASFQNQGASAPQGADLRLSDIVGQQRKRPEDEMTLGMMMGGY